MNDTAPTPDSFAAIINLWETAEEMAADLGEKGVTVRQWRNRGSIPSDRWLAVAAAAEKRGFAAVTLNLMAGLAAKQAA
jgi:hypothetical protein